MAVETFPLAIIFLLIGTAVPVVKRAEAVTRFVITPHAAVVNEKTNKIQVLLSDIHVVVQIGIKLLYYRTFTPGWGKQTLLL